MLAFLLTGGLGAGAQIDICTDADGTVHLETGAHQCCHPDDQPCEDAGAGSSWEFSPSSDKACGSCTDIEITLAASRDLTHRTVKVAAADDHDLAPDLGVSLLYFDPSDNCGGYPSHAPKLSVPISVPNTVLRC